jgi:hypothetical protein
MRVESGVPGDQVANKTRSYRYLGQIDEVIHTHDPVINDSD